MSAAAHNFDGRPAVEDDEFDGDEFDEDAAELNRQIIRAKWVMDGAETLSEASARLRGFADWLDEAASAGWELDSEVDDDYGFLAVPAAIAALEPEWVRPLGDGPGVVTFLSVAMDVGSPLTWRCITHPGGTWEATIVERLGGDGCPVCSAL